MVYGLLELTKDALKLDLQIAPTELSDARFMVCETCPQYQKAIKKCARCGCYMPVKTKLTKAVCPLKKW